MTPNCSSILVALVVIACVVATQAVDPTRMPKQKMMQTEGTQNAIDDQSQILSRFTGQQLLELLLEKYRRAIVEDSAPTYDQTYDDDYDSQRIKRYQRWGRGRIGGTIVMGKRK
ncbi:hypothetical protein M3Y97_01107500 [Aphelenchoides bicaudatus]|nr:hypothetical protein M3Y97_01107500 [Aphelenchoides bicaudatus]